MLDAEKIPVIWEYAIKYMRDCVICDTFMSISLAVENKFFSLILPICV